MNIQYLAALAAFGRGISSGRISTTGLTEAQLFFPCQRLVAWIVQDYTPATAAAFYTVVNGLTALGFNSYMSLALGGMNISHTLTDSSEPRPREAFLAVLNATWLMPASGGSSSGGLSSSELQTVLDRYFWDTDANAPKTILPVDIPVLEISRSGNFDEF